MTYFSVIIPVYNIEQYVCRCVDSVLQQNFTDYEVILVDDGSTDRSGILCDEHAQVHPQIRVIHKENGGLSSARNAGVKQAKGEYIWFVDGDDWIEQGALDALYACARETDADLIKFGYIRVENSAQWVCKSSVAPQVYTDLTALQEEAFYYGGRYVLSAWSHAYKRQFLQKNDLYFVSEREIGSEDYLFNLQALLCAPKVAVLENALYYYEQRMGSLTQRYKKELPRRYTQLYSHLRRYAKLQGKDRYMGKICAFYIWHLMRGTCIPNAYMQTADHTLKEGRREVRQMLKNPSVRRALKQMDRTRYSKKERLLIRCMQYKIEPAIYWLYVKKPAKRGKNK